MPTPEKKMKAKVSKMLEFFGEDAWYFYPGNNGYGKSGVPDIVASVYGTFIGIEVKADETKKATKLQALQGQRINDSGGRWHLVRSEEDIEALFTQLKELEELKGMISCFDRLELLLKHIEEEELEETERVH
tara:strand:- start:1347 stop:1742 length:396 start_codon:yes stop_codon:yes gene_type:complete